MGRKPRDDQEAAKLWRVYYCKVCDCYYARLLGWQLATNHHPTTKSVIDGTRTFTYAKHRCGGPARVVRDPAVLAAYRLGGEAAVYELLGPDAKWG